MLCSSVHAFYVKNQFDDTIKKLLGVSGGFYRQKCKLVKKSVKPRQYNTEFLKDDTNEYNFTNIKNNEEKSLIERNISDPSPTMDAKFRVISNTEINNRDYIDSNSQYETSYDYDESNIDQYRIC